METLSCQETAEALFRLSEGTLGHQDRDKLEAHVRKCETCHRLSLEYRRVISMSRRLFKEPEFSSKTEALLDFLRSQDLGSVSGVPVSENRSRKGANLFENQRQ